MAERRKTLLINAVQQRRLVMGGLLSAILLINSLAIATVMVKPALLQLIELPHTLALAGVEIVIIAAVGYLSLILSHKIMGPAYALTRDLKRLGEGDLTVRTRLRQGDFHTEVMEAFNLAGESLCSRIKTLKANLIILQQQPDIPDPMRQRIKGLLNELSYFQTEPPLTKDPQRSAQDRGAVAGMEKPQPSR